MGQYYSEEFKKAAIQKLLTRGFKSVKSVCEDLGVSSPSIYEWKRFYATDGHMAQKKRRPKDRSAAEKYRAVMEYCALSEADQGEFLRREGLHSDHIDEWKKLMEAGLESAVQQSAPVTKAELAQLRSENKELKRDLHRKDKALAETSALLILKKKADLIWGTGENE
jgi:transposase